LNAQWSHSSHFAETRFSAFGFVHLMLVS
jgi:hypothetical protein